MKKILFLSLFFSSLIGYSQNLVPNPSFETYTTCPIGPSTLGTDVPPWSTPDTATPDYYNVCNNAVFPMPSMDVPDNIQGSQNARTGVGYGGLIAHEQSFGFNTDYREYMQVQLTSPLTAGQDYCVEFYWNLAGKSVYYIEEMGVYFSNTVTNLLQSTTLPFTPQVSVSGSPLNDTTNWVLFQQSYTAVGGEEYIIIGNFNNPGATTSGATGVASSMVTGGDFAYYYIEDVKVEAGPCIIPCDATISGAGPFCSSDPSTTLTSLFPGGTWTGTGITNGTTGAFDPATAGVGTHTITYTLSCGDVQTTSITVSACTALSACLESNGDLTVSGGNGPYTWESQSTTADCSSCFGGTCVPFVCEGVQVPDWTATGTTVAGPGAGLYPIDVTDANGTVLTITSSGSLPSCSSTCTPPTLSSTQIDVTCLGGNDGSIDLTITGTSTYDVVWSNGPTTEDISTLAAGAYTVTVTDQADATCTATTTVTIIDGGQPTVVANATFTTICQGDPVTLTGSGASTYTWTGGVTDGVAFNPPATASYTVTGTDASGCTNTDAITVTVNNCSVPTASFTTASTTLCENDCISFTDQSTGTSISSWSWSFPGATTTTSTDQNPTNICYPTAGTYTVSLTVTDANGTDDSTMTNYITVNNCSVPTASFTTASTTLCENDCISFTDQSTGTSISSWSWSFPGAITTTSTDQNPASICYPTAGTYTVSLTVTDANGTDDSTMTNYITVTNCSQPTASFSASSTSLCQGDCISFTDQSIGTVGGVIYAWSFPGASTSSSTDQNPTNICYPAAGTYTVTLSITDNNGTDDTTMTNYITVANCTTPIANFSISNTAFCAGECIDFTDLSTGGATSWLWSFPGGIPAASADQNPMGICFFVDGTITVTLIATNSVGSDTSIQTITVFPAPTVDAGADVTIPAGVTTTLEAIGSADVTTYLWSPADDLSCTLCDITDASPELTTTYTVTVTDASGCTGFDDVTVFTIFEEGIGVPSAFSPNGDDHNDILYVEGAGIIELQFIVYNRYGQKVFESNDKDLGWDGTFNGKEENPGVFAYVAVYKLVSGAEGVLKGDVTLIK